MRASGSNPSFNRRVPVGRAIPQLRRSEEDKGTRNRFLPDSKQPAPRGLGILRRFMGTGTTGLDRFPLHVTMQDLVPKVGKYRLLQWIKQFELGYKVYPIRVRFREAYRLSKQWKGRGIRGSREDCDTSPIHYEVYRRWRAYRCAELYPLSVAIPLGVKIKERLRRRDIDLIIKGRKVEIDADTLALAQAGADRKLAKRVRKLPEKEQDFLYNLQQCGFALSTFSAILDFIPVDFFTQPGVRRIMLDEWGEMLGCQFNPETGDIKLNDFAIGHTRQSIVGFLLWTMGLAWGNWFVGRYFGKSTTEQTDFDLEVQHHFGVLMEAQPPVSSFDLGFWHNMSFETSWTLGVAFSTGSNEFNIPASPRDFFAQQVVNYMAAGNSYRAYIDNLQSFEVRKAMQFFHDEFLKAQIFHGTEYDDPAGSNLRADNSPD